MIQRICGMIVILCIVHGCSSPEPPIQFLNSRMKIAGYKNDDGTPKMLAMRPIDLYNIFDVDVTKKWKKNSVNTWKLIINLQETAEHGKKTLVFTITEDISMSGGVMIDGITLDNKPAPGMVAELLKLDESFVRRKRGTSGNRK